jgi:hypothetical protein
VTDVWFAAAVGLCLGPAAVLTAAAYFRRFRLGRPAVGVFNSADVLVMLAFVVVMPLLYVAVAGWVMPAVLGLVFFGVLSVGAEPVVRRRWPRRALVAGLLGADIVVWSAGSPWYGVVNSVLVVLVCVCAANLNVQGGFALRHAAWFVLALAAYDLFFIAVVPLTQRLFAAAEGYVFAPVALVRVGDLATAVGMGDVLAYALVGLAAYKGYGRVGLAWATAAVAVFGGLAPALAPLAVEAVTGRAPGLVPAQALFGPAAFGTYLLLRRRGPERRMAEALPAVPTVPAAA